MRVEKGFRVGVVVVPHSGGRSQGPSRESRLYETVDRPGPGVSPVDDALLCPVSGGPPRTRSDRVVDDRERLTYVLCGTIEIRSSRLFGSTEFLGQASNRESSLV